MQTFAGCKLFFYHDSIKNFTSIDAFEVVLLPAAKQRIFNYNIKLCPFALPVNF